MQLTCKLSDFRSERKLSQGHLAKRCGITVSYVSKIERGERDPGVALALKLAASVDSTVNQIWSVI